MRHHVAKLATPLMLFFSFCIMSPSAWAATTITADYLEHFSNEDKYVAVGNVKIEKDKAVVYSDRAILYQKTSDAELTGHVIYEDPTTVINSERAELNLDTNTGKLFNALIFLKQQKSLGKTKEKTGYWIKGDNVQKIKEDHYHASTATFTTCDAKSYTEGEFRELSKEKAFEAGGPDWCFKGGDVDIRVGQRVAARNTTYRVKGLPVLYSPYFWMPIKSGRETGLLFPLIGNSSQKGFQLSNAFFWAIDENKDATFNLDYYSKRGFGEGVEYRYLDFNDRGRWYVYHLKDDQLKKTFYELRGMHDQKLGDIRGFIDVNYVNHADYLKEYAYKRDDRVQRFLQSTGEASLPLRNSRAYLLGQYWVDLQDENSNVPQRLPELGYVVNTTGVGPLNFFMSSSAANFRRDKEVSGQRIDLNPTLSYSFGDWIQFYQSLSLRETAYNLKNSETSDSNPHRETFEYRANALTRFVKRLSSGAVHIIEPSFTYRFIPQTRPPLPSGFVFDSTELPALTNKTSIAQLAVLNTLNMSGLSLYARLTQPYDLNAVSPAHPLLPTLFEAGMGTRYFGLSMSMTEDFNTMNFETLTSTISVNAIPGTAISLGQTYGRLSKIMQYNIGLTSVLTKKWSVGWNAYYDAKGPGLRDMDIRARYTQQCWMFDIIFTRKPGDNVRPADYSFLFMIQLKGLGEFKLYELNSQSPQRT